MKTPRRKPRKKTPLTDFVRATKPHKGGQRSPIDDNPTATADLEAFAKMKTAGTADASWAQFAVWFRATHGIAMRANSLYVWAQTRGFLDGK